ncbi:MAG: apolipoprotein N-acyltransferase [Pseudomonadota bacterium]
MGYRPWIAALAGGFLAAPGHAPFSLWYLAVPGFVVFVWAVTKASTKRQGFTLAWSAATAYFGITLHWIVEPFLVDAATHGWMAPGALILLAGGLALFWGAAGWAAVRFGGSPLRTGLAFATALTVAELVRGYIFTGFPWAMPAYIWAETPLRAAVAYTGSYGLTFLTVLGAALLASTPSFRAGLLAGPAVFALLLAGGYARLNSADAPQALGTVGLVHPSVPQTEKWQRDKVSGHLNRMFGLTEELASAAEPVDLIVWPEVAVVYPLDAAGPILSDVAGAAAGTPVILGINRRDEGEWFNSLVTVQPDGEAGEAYDKVHLVPFGEYIPFRLGFLRAMAATSSNGFSSGEAVRLIDTPLGQALPLICYEGIFPRHIFRAGARADYILLITNDAWFGTFAGPYQHLDQARFRAAEHGLPVVRAANSGVSTVIDRFGRVDQALGLDQIGAARHTVQTGDETLYARTGNIPLVLLLVVLCTGLWWSKPRNAIAKDRA